MLLFMLVGCTFLADLLNSDEIIDATCVGTDTVVIDGRDICDEYEKYGRVQCDVGYTIRLDGVQVCPSAPP